MKRGNHIDGKRASRRATLAVCLALAVWIASAFPPIDPAVHAEEDTTDYSVAPEVVAPSGVLMDMRSGKVLFEKDKDAQREPAGTTKIMTALLALENLKPEDAITVDEQTYATDGSGLYLLAGETISVDNLMYALMLPAENDVAAPLAKAISGNVEAFAERMNARAAEIGATGTHFVNPNGNHVDNHVSTAYDMALIAREAMKNEHFRRYAGAIEYILPATNKQQERQIRNANRLLYDESRSVMVYNRQRPILCEGAIGVKTGYTAQAGNCIVASASRNGLELIAVVMGAGSTMVYADALEMLEYGFHNYENITVFATGGKIAEIPVKGGKSKQVNAVFAQDVNATVPKGVTAGALDVRVTSSGALDAPVTAGAVVGVATAYMGEEKLGESALITESAVDKTELGKMIKATGNVLSVIVKIVIGIIAVLAVWIAVVLIRAELRKRNRRRRKLYNGATREVKRVKRIKH
ncbi:MAG: D-alanyl-D-alanine carboxypeptidase [Clostridiales Family XIII bacterium]|nr:D-alanyl-D-alanine carboxypeptidase [Clostridiales Family XIII bacterium]